MFTEGLDKSALKWVREKDSFGSLSSSNLRPSNDAILGTRYGGRGCGLPPPAKFCSGHLPAGAIPVTRTMANVNGSASENDTSTDSEDGEGAYRGRYSLDSSPQDERFPDVTAYRCGKPLQKGPSYATDYTYSDVSSSRENVVARRVPAAERLVRENGRNPVGWNLYKEDESSDSAASSEFSTTQVESTKGAFPRDRRNRSVGYASSAASLSNAGRGARKQGSIAISRDDNLSDNDLASAPPLSKSEEIKMDSCNTQTKGMFMSKTDIGNKRTEHVDRSAAGDETLRRPNAPRIPVFHALALGPWHAVIAYDACVRLCLNAWARGCMEAPMFLENECSLLRNSFGLHQVLLQSEEELLAKRSSEPTYEGAVSKPKKFSGKMKVQVRKVKSVLDPPTGCNMLSLRAPTLRTSSINIEAIRDQLSNFQSILSSRWQSLRRIRSMPRLANGNFSRQSLAYVHASARYLKQVPALFKVGITSLRNSSSTYEAVQETYSCLLRLKSKTVEDIIRMQTGSGENHIFFPDSPGDDLIIEVHDSKGKLFGSVVVQVATVAEDPADKLRWWPVFREPEHELVGKVQLYICYSTSCDDNGHLKYGTVAETVAYDLVLEVAMKVQQFQQRNLLLHGSWKWLLEEFASYYGVSDVYTKLRYLSYVMDVATPTADCLMLVHELLIPVLMKGSNKFTLSHQENRILGETKDQIEQIFGLVFENYKSLDESSFSGIMDTFRPATGVAAPALEPAIKLYILLHDILSPEVQNKLCQHFQVATKKRARRLLAETDEYVAGNSEGTVSDPLAMSAAYQKMTSLCANIKNEISTDIMIHNLHVLPSFVDLPNLSAAIYSSELCNRLRAFLTACPPQGPSLHVAELVIAAADFQKDLANWKISHVKGGVEAKELFHIYILRWIQDTRIFLLESCKMDKVKWSGVRTQHSTTPFIDEMYDRLRRTLNDYEVIICRWPEYVFVLENAAADVEKAIVEALDKQYADVLSPLKENLSPKKFGIKYVQKLAKRSACTYTVPDELALLLNSLKRMLDILRPKIETQFKSWGSCMPSTSNTAPGECLSEITVMLRSKFRNYLQAVVEKLVENSKLQDTTKMKKILKDSKGIVVEADVRSRMQPLREQLIDTMNHLHSIFETHVFLALCRGYWDRMGQEVLSFLENRKENRSWYKGSQIAVSILDDTFASQIQELRGNALQEKDLEPPRSIMEVRSILCKDGPEHKDNIFYY